MTNRTPPPTEREIRVAKAIQSAAAEDFKAHELPWIKELYFRRGYTHIPPEVMKVAQAWHELKSEDKATYYVLARAALEAADHGT